MKLSFEYLIALDNNKELKKFNNNELEFILNSHTDKNLRMFLRSEGVRGYSKYKKKADLVKFIIDLVREDKQLTIEDMVKQTEKVIKQLALPEPVNIDKNEQGFYFEERDCVSEKDLKYAYKVMSNKLHPDKNGNENKFEEMNNEYSIRKQYIGKDGRDISRDVFVKALDTNSLKSTTEHEINLNNIIIENMMTIGDKYHRISNKNNDKRDIYVNGKLVYRRW